MKTVKSPIISALLIVVLAVAAGPYIYFDSVAADLQDYTAEYEKLDNAGSENPQDWLQLAGNARAAQKLGVAGKALDKAAHYGLGPIRLGMEKARILVVSDDPGGATSQLSKLFAAGFASVGVLTSDPLINSLAGRSDYDELIANMSVQAYPCALAWTFGCPRC